MAIVQQLDQAYVDTQLVCPPGKNQIEIVDPQRTGLYIEVRAAKPLQGTYYLRCKDADGKTARRRIGFTTDVSLEDARAEALRLKADMRMPSAHVSATQPASATVVPLHANPADEMTLDTFWTEHYLPHAKVHKRSAWRDEQIYKRITVKFGHLPLRGVSRLAVQQFQNALLISDALAVATVNQHVVLLRRMLNLAVSWEMLDKNVLTRIPLLFKDNRVEHFLDDDQVRALVNVLKTDDNRLVSLIVLFLLSTGARKSEALKAEWSQVDVERRIWRIPATNSKSKKMKSLPLNDSAMWVVEQLSSKGNSAYLFPSPATGKPFNEITRVWYRLRTKAGLPANIRIHDLRHTFASRLVSSGRSLYEVQMLLGHADPRMTMRYSHLNMKTMQEASNAVALNVA